MVLVGKGKAVLPLKPSLLGSASVEIEGVVFDLELVAFGEPAAFSRRLGEGGKDSFGSYRIIALNHEGAVDHGSL